MSASETFVDFEENPSYVRMCKTGCFRKTYNFQMTVGGELFWILGFLAARLPGSMNIKPIFWFTCWNFCKFWRLVGIIAMQAWILQNKVYSSVKEGQRGCTASRTDSTPIQRSRLAIFCFLSLFWLSAFSGLKSILQKGQSFFLGKLNLLFYNICRC